MPSAAFCCRSRRPPTSRPIRWVRNTVKRFLEFCRTVPGIVFALIFVIAFGLGPLPGVLAIAIHTAGALGKLFSEVVENIDMKPVEAAKSTGGNWPETVRFAALPQVLSNFASYTLLRFEINVREASVLGFVGAGGIGQDLIEAIRKFYYSDVSAILVMIIATVMVIDIVTAKLRHRLIGKERAAVSGFPEQAAVRDLAGLRDRYPDVFKPLTRGRVIAVLIATAVAGVAGARAVASGLLLHADRQRAREPRPARRAHAAARPRLLGEGWSSS